MSRPVLLRQLRDAVPLIAPSMLKCDFGNLHREVEQLESAGAKLLHLDVMDGHFVPNLSYGPVVIERLRELTEIPFDAHLMISDPARYLDEFLKAGCDCVTFHIEAVDDPLPLLEKIQAAGALSGLALNPGTSVERLEPALSLCDLVLVMSVEPGFGGQQFMPNSLEKLKRLKQSIQPDTLLAVDGGIGPSTIRECARSGANMFVAGSAIFDANDYQQAIDELSQLAQVDVTTPTLEN